MQFYAHIYPVLWRHDDLVVILSCAGHVPNNMSARHEDICEMAIAHVLDPFSKHVTSIQLLVVGVLVDEVLLLTRI
mgnify:CR=1 FL=1